MTQPGSDLEKILAETTAEIQHAAEEIQETATDLRRVNPLLWPLPWLALALLVAVFMVMKYSSTQSVTETKVSDTKQFPQLYMTNVEAQTYDAKGDLHSQLKTPLVQHFQAKDKSPEYNLMNQPHIILRQDPNSPEWNITADEGANEDKSDWFILKKNVLAVQESQTQGQITVSSDEMKVNAHDQFAQTDKAVTMRTSKSVVNAVGMNADIKKNTIQLLSQVKGTYEP